MDSSLVARWGRDYEATREGKPRAEAITAAKAEMVPTWAWKAEVGIDIHRLFSFLK